MNRKLMAYFIVSIFFIAVNFFISSVSYKTSLSLDTLSMYPIVILFLCLALGWIKKEQITPQMKYDSLFSEKTYLLLGAILVIISILMPISSRIELTFFMLGLTLIGMSFIFFGSAAYLPSLLLFIYGFSVSFPVIFGELFGTQYALITTRLTANIANLFYPVAYDGQVISIINNVGLQNLVFIDAACSGSASLAIFFTVFILMLIDIKPRQKYVIPLFIFGVVGTSIQNILRLVILLSTNYYLGTDAMWKMHDYAGYILFPLWFSFFIYVYLTVGVGKRKEQREEIPAVDPAENV